MKKEIIIVSFGLLIFLGCDDVQSPSVRFVNNVDIRLWATQYGPPSAFDQWRIDPGNDNIIHSASFGYLLTVQAYGGEDSAPVGGIRVDCYVSHCDPTGGSYDIWRKSSPGFMNGIYGHITGLPEAGSSWSFVDNHAIAYTSSMGSCAFFVGLGAPNVSEDYEKWVWPYGSSTMVSTGVGLRFAVRRHPNPISSSCHAYFLRGQGAGFWLPEGMGAFYTSYSSLESPPETWGLGLHGTQIQGDTIMQASSSMSDAIPRDKKPGFYPVEKSKSNSGEDIGIDWIVEDAYWAQLQFSGYEWIWNTNIDALYALISPDSMIENDANTILSMSQPYGFLIDIIPELNSVGAEEHMAVLESRSSSGGLVSWLPIKIRKYEVVGTDLLRYLSEYIVPIDSSNGEGRHTDWWDETGIFIKTVEGGYLKVVLDDFYGDFNFDGSVDWLDYVLLLDHPFGLTFEAPAYNLSYDGNKDGIIDKKDLAIFTDQWLKKRMME